MDTVKDLPVEELARKMSQEGDTCAFASAMFSLAMQYRATGQLSQPLYEDLADILSERVGYKRVLGKVQRPSETPYGPRPPVNLGDVDTYFRHHGYTIVYADGTREELTRHMSDHPIVGLHFDMMAASVFFSWWTAGTYYSEHIICATGIGENNNLLFFDPDGGRIRSMPQTFFDNIVTEIGVIHPLKEAPEDLPFQRPTQSELSP